MKVRCDEGGDIWWNGEMVQNGGAGPLHSRYRVEAANEADLSMAVSGSWCPYCANGAPTLHPGARGPLKKLGQKLTSTDGPTMQS